MHPSIHARSAPDKGAFVVAGSGRIVSYRQLGDASNRLARLLRDQGLTGKRYKRLPPDKCWAGHTSKLV